MILVLVVGCRKEKESSDLDAVPGPTINAPNGTTLEWAVRVARTGQTIELTGSVYFVTDTSALRRGISLIGVGTKKPIISYSGYNRGPIIEVYGDNRIDNIAFEMYPGNATEVVRGVGVTNVIIANNDAQLNLAHFINARNVTIEKCVVNPPTWIAGVILPWRGIFFDQSAEITIRKNTVVGPQTGVEFRNTTNVLFEENIVAGGGTMGVGMDATSIATATIQYNCAWNNGPPGIPQDFYDFDSRRAFTPNGLGNISVNPGIIGAGDFRLLPGSAAATAGKTGGPIGARGVR